MDIKIGRLYTTVENNYKLYVIPTSVHIPHLYFVHIAHAEKMKPNLPDFDYEDSSCRLIHENWLEEMR